MSIRPEQRRGGTPTQTVNKLCRLDSWVKAGLHKYYDNIIILKDFHGGGFNDVNGRERKIYTLCFHMKATIVLMSSPYGILSLTFPYTIISVRGGIRWLFFALEHSPAFTISKSA